MSEEVARYKPCRQCSEARASENFELALRCRSCRGTGVVRTPESYVCNMCGKNSCADRYPAGLTEARVCGGYSSFFLTDCTSYTFTICEECLRTKLFEAFVVPPLVSDTDFWDEGDTVQTAYERDLAYYKDRERKRAVDVNLQGELIAVGAGHPEEVWSGCSLVPIAAVPQSENTETTESLSSDLGADDT